MDYEAGELLIEGNNYYVQSKKRFIAYASALEDDKMKCFEFAYDMSYGNKGEHRDSRSGGTAHRTNPSPGTRNHHGSCCNKAADVPER